MCFTNRQVFTSVSYLLIYFVEIECILTQYKTQTDTKGYITVKENFSRALKGVRKRKTEEEMGLS